MPSLAAAAFAADAHCIRRWPGASAKREGESECGGDEHGSTHHHADVVIGNQLVADGEHCTISKHRRQVAPKPGR
jgi:hypothetical protein